MKINSFLTGSLTFLCVGLLAVSCSDKAALPANTGRDLRVSAPFASQTTRFAFEMTRQVNQQEAVGKNLFVSPLSLHIALGMILNGADAQTAQEIQKTLNLDAQTLADVNATYQYLMQNLPGVDPSITLRLANSVWYRHTFAVEPAFKNLLTDTFRATVSGEDFDSPATVGKINGWASAQTNGKIPKVIDQVSPQNVLFLLNALYFKGDWQTRFKPEETVDEPFTLTSGGQKTVRMMRLNTKLRRAFMPTYTAFELPYGADRFVMTVLLPNGSTTATNLLQTLNADNWTQLQKDLTPGLIDIGLPKFSFSYDIKLNSVLAAMGMPTAFTDRADFSRINRNGGILLSTVKQNTFVAVDETGTEAAAVTTGEISVTSAPQPYLCNRPFVIVIHEKTSGTVLFTGKIADPTVTN